MFECYSDDSWITSSGENKPTSSWIFTLLGVATSLDSKKQACMSHSTTKLDFIALAAAGNEVEWLRNLLLGKNFWPQLMGAISLHCYSDETMSRAFNKIYNGKSKHISLRHAFVRQLILTGVITIVYVRS